MEVKLKSKGGQKSDSFDSEATPFCDCEPQMKQRKRHKLENISENPRRALSDQTAVKT